VAASNHHARRLYERLGFVERRLVEFMVLEAPPA
jgi:predicted GNAT family acetyltransferase